MPEQVADGYTWLLRKQPWHWFATFTFKPQKWGATGGVHPEKADKAFRLFVSCLNRELYGPRWADKKHGGVTWARGQEFHKSGRIHFHALFASPDKDLNVLARRMSWVDWWWTQGFGIARIERPSSQGDVAGYISKYVTKDGEVDFSRNFGQYRPPDLFDLRPQEIAAG